MTQLKLRHALIAMLTASFGRIGDKFLLPCCINRCLRTLFHPCVSKEKEVLEKEKEAPFYFGYTWYQRDLMAMAITIYWLGSDQDCPVL